MFKTKIYVFDTRVFPRSKNLNINKALFLHWLSVNMYCVYQMHWASVEIWWYFVPSIFVKRNLSPGLLWWSSLQTKEGQRHTEFLLIGFENSQTPSTTTVWPSDHREDYRSWGQMVLSKQKCCLLSTGVSTESQKRTSVLQIRQGFLATRNMTRINFGLTRSNVKLLLSSWKTYMCNLMAWYINK